MLRAITALLALAVGASAVPVAANDDPGLLCDRLAASPLDLELPSDIQGVPFEQLTASEAAFDACLAAIKSQPNTARYVTNLGRLYDKQGNLLDALEAYRKAHSRGSAVAAYNLGSMYEVGRGAAQNHERATQYYRKAANRGLPYSMGTMGDRLRTGTGSSQNLGLAVFWYEKGAEAGDSASLVELALMYQNGLGVRENDERAVDLIAEALRLDPGDAFAAYNLALAYERGEGVPVDHVWARGYYAVAFDSGDADAAAKLGQMSAKGMGSVADPVAAAAWYARGAAQGSLVATVSLADAYRDGKGVTADLASAEDLYDAALALKPNGEWRARILDRKRALSVLRATE